MSNRVADHLGHMLEAAVRACAYVEGFQKADFLEDKKTPQAVVLNLILIGEEASKLLKDHDIFALANPQFMIQQLPALIDGAR